MDVRLGAYDPMAPAKVTPLGFLYFSFGLDDYGPKRVMKTARRLTAAGVLPAVVSEFEAYAAALPVELPNWIDSAYQARMGEWRACIGARLPNGREITGSALARILPRSIRLIFHPAPFTVPPGRLVAGCAYSDRIELVMAAISDGGTWLRRADRLAEWELGNLIARRLGFAPADANLEIGNKRPCV